MIEILVSSILLVIVAGGVFTAFDSSTRSTSEERHRARAHALAQADLSRMRTMRISALSNLAQSSVVNQDGTPYTIESRGEYQTDATGTASCESGTASADYIKISATVTWPSMGSRPPVYASTLVAPPNGSVSPDSGSLAIGVEDAANEGIGGIGISGSGAGTFSGVTGPEGCAIFGNLPAGNYTVTFSGVSDLVDVDGNAPGPIATSVVAESTNTVVVQYDDPGDIPTTFTTKPYGGGAVVPSTADSIIAFNTGMTASRAFPPTPGAPASSITASPMFPFTSDYAIYAGTCEGDNPNPLGVDPPPAPLAIASVLLPPGGSEPAVIQLPALHLRVYQGSDTSSARADGAVLKIWDIRCSNFPRNFTATSNGITTDGIGGQLADPGLPYSDYAVCAYYAPLNRRKIQTVSMNDPPDVTGGQTLNMFLGFGTTSAPCP